MYSWRLKGKKVAQKSNMKGKRIDICMKGLEIQISGMFGLLCFPSLALGCWLEAKLSG